ncbi:unnamed protein product [Orchesella dallaii]|uniref:F-box domain-containing protein n=1 Tax=Orchesella dallaii TaxID=48710 RepID=A0ABP1QZP4_9HEXA
MNPPQQHVYLEGAGDDDPIEKISPLFHEVIMKNCFKGMSIEELKNIRLVCKFWWETSLLQWRNGCVVQIRGGRRKERSRSVNMARSAQLAQLSVRDFIPFMGEMDADNDPFKLSAIPFRKYHLSCLDLDILKSGRDYSNQLKFWRSFGAQMKNLKISWSVFHNAPTFSRILFEETPGLETLQLEKNLYKSSSRYRGSLSAQSPTPQFVKNGQNKLNTMSIILREFDAEELYRSPNTFPIELPLSWVQILAYFPNLVNVQLENIDSDDFSCPSLEGFLDTITSLRCSCNLKTLNLNVLNIMNAKRNSILTLSDRILTPLQILRLPLTSLSFDIGIQTRAEVFGEILRIHAPTLKQLTVYRAPYIRAFPDFPFGTLLNFLEELTAIGPIFQDLLFLEFTPRLRRLIIVDEDSDKPFELAIGVAEELIGEYRNPEPVISNTDFTLIGDVQLKHLDEFNAGTEEVSCDEKLKALENLMPNLQKLHLMPNYNHRIV